MIVIKSKEEIELMRKAGKIVALALKACEDTIKPGVTTMELNNLCKRIILENGAKPSFEGYGGFPYAICASVNDVVVHGFPNNKPLSSGDIVTIDVGACYKGYHGDSAVTFPVGEISAEDQKLINVTKESLIRGLSKVKAGVHLTDISHEIGSYVKPYGYGIVEEFTGHGVGLELHEDPQIFNFGLAGYGPVLLSGMTLAIEPMINAGTKRVKVLSDHWTTVTCDKKKSAHFEHSIVVTEDGYEILTTL